MDSTHRFPRVIGLFLWAIATAVIAQGTDRASPVLTQEQVTEDNLVLALTPEIAASGTSHRSRGLRPAITKGSTSYRSNGSPRPSASLLITFETDSTTLTQVAAERLDVLAAALNKDALKAFSFAIEGHADSRGRHDSNMTLSERRAAAVRKYLVESRGVSESRLTAVGKGDSEPMNRDNAAAAENRRVTIVTLVP